MIFYKGYPRAAGVTDFCDSAVLAGLLSVFKWPNFVIPNYFDQYGNPLRSRESDIPNDECFNPTTMSRDQLVPLMAGYYAQGFYNSCQMIFSKLSERHFLCPNNDLLSPSQKGHMKFCAGLNPSFIENQWLYLDIVYASFIQPMQESNQLLCMLIIRDLKYLRLYTKLNKNWRECVREYWGEGAGSWRMEPELAEHMIKTIEIKINT